MYLGPSLGWTIQTKVETLKFETLLAVKRVQYALAGTTTIDKNFCYSNTVRRTVTRRVVTSSEGAQAASARVRDDDTCPIVYMPRTSAYERLRPSVRFSIMASSSNPGWVFLPILGFIELSVLTVLAKNSHGTLGSFFVNVWLTCMDFRTDEYTAQ
jgi:hypothetical protein